MTYLTWKIREQKTDVCDNLQEHSKDKFIFFNILINRLLLFHWKIIFVLQSRDAFSLKRIALEVLEKLKIMKITNAVRS